MHVLATLIVDLAQGHNTTPCCSCSQVFLMYLWLRLQVRNIHGPSLGGILVLRVCVLCFPASLVAFSCDHFLKPESFYETVALGAFTLPCNQICSKPVSCPDGCVVCFHAPFIHLIAVSSGGKHIRGARSLRGRPCRRTSPPQVCYVHLHLTVYMKTSRS